MSQVSSRPPGPEPHDSDIDEPFYADDDTPKEACGVFGVFAPGQPVAHLTYLGLYALQHRGQESAGMAVSARGPTGRPGSLHRVFQCNKLAWRTRRAPTTNLACKSRGKGLGPRPMGPNRPFPANPGVGGILKVKSES